MLAISQIRRFIAMKRLSAIICFVLLVPSIVWSATYYVSTTGSDANSCATATSSTPSNAKRTMTGINGAQSCIVASDTVLVHPDGLYTDTAWCADTKISRQGQQAIQPRSNQQPQALGCNGQCHYRFRVIAPIMRLPLFG